MGLTIHYSIAVPKDWSNGTVRAKLESLRQFCLDLPVEEVSELQVFKGKDCEPGDAEDDPFRWAKIQATRSLKSPWRPGTHFQQQPSQMIVFSVWPARGCEEMNVGVCSFRQFVCPKRKPMKEIETYGGHASGQARVVSGNHRCVKLSGFRPRLERLCQAMEVAANARVGGLPPFP